MIAAVESLLPIFVLIGLGFILRWRNVVPEDMWRGVELLGYWVFFPALLSETLIEADLASLPLASITFTMALAFATMAGALLALRLPIMRALEHQRRLLQLAVSEFDAVERFHRPANPRQALWQ